jgi:AcrR family transcriptional regulator
MATVTSGLRERKKTATRRAISDAALALAVERGPMAITVEDIAAAADVSPRTVFNYFPSKEAAILGFDPENLQDLVDRLDARPVAEAPLEALRETMRGSSTDDALSMQTRARLTADNPQLQSAFIAGFAKLEDQLTDAMAARLGLDIATDSYPRLVVKVGLTAMRVAVAQAIAQPHNEAAGSAAAVTKAVDDAFNALAAGLPVPTRKAAPSRRR